MVTLFLAVAGCVSGGDWVHDEPVKPEPMTAQQQAAPEAAPSAPALSRAATAAAAPGANVNDGELLDCVTQSCKINCSPKVKKQFQPKWCARFKEPVEN
jgi:hypothetical protein